MKIYTGYPRLARNYTLMVDEYEHPKIAIIITMLIYIPLAIGFFGAFGWIICQIWK